MEVDEEVRHDRMMRRWKRYGRFVILAIALIVISVGAREFWRSMHTDTLRGDGDSLYGWLGKGPISAADARLLLDFSETASNGAGLVATLHGASTLRRVGKMSESTQLYDRIATERAETPVGKSAKILAALNLIDETTPQDITTRLQGLAVPDQPWRHLAREVIGLSWLRAANYEEARKIFQELVDDTTAPPSVRERALRTIAILKN